jgi:hypothetical protein
MPTNKNQLAWVPVYGSGRQFAPPVPAPRGDFWSSLQRGVSKVAEFVGEVFATIVYSIVTLVEGVLGLTLGVLAIPLLLFGTLILIGLIIHLAGLVLTAFGSA